MALNPPLLLLLIKEFIFQPTLRLPVVLEYESLSSILDDDDGGVTGIVSRDRLIALNFTRTNDIYGVTISWKSDTDDDKMIEDINELFSTLEGCKITYSWEK